MKKLILIFLLPALALGQYRDIPDVV